MTVCDGYISFHNRSCCHLQHLLSAIQTASFWSNAAIVKVHAVCLAPRFQAMLEYTSIGSLETYLRQPHRGLIVRDLVDVAEDIAQALYYLVSLYLDVLRLGESLLGCTTTWWASSWM